ncbi:hypothetical protein DINM_007098 [Dirofilaria immitis]|nr:hypothetical protein [Dirofilaria immitis]
MSSRIIYLFLYCRDQVLMNRRPGIRKLPPTPEEILANRQASEEMAKKVEKLQQLKENELSTDESKTMPYIESTTISDDFDSQPRGFPRYVDYDKKQPEMS